MKQRSIGLDILRTFAILFVLVSHGLYIFYEALDPRIGNLLNAYGHYGVSLFFVLSGFLIGRIFLKDFFADSPFTGKQLITFWKRRWFRTLPNYYLFLIIYIFFAILVSIGIVHVKDWKANFTLEESSQLIKFLFFTQNLVTAGPTFLGQSWSLSVEEWFYLLLPFIIASVIIKKTKRSPLSLPFRLMVVLLLLILWKLYIFFSVPTFFHEMKVIFCLDYILFGVVLAAFDFAYREKLQRWKNKMLWIGISLFIANNLLYLKFILVKEPSWAVAPFLNVLSALSYSFLLPFFNSLRLKENWFTWLVEKISLASYTIYLSHFIFFVLLGDNFFFAIVPEEANPMRLLAFLLITSVCITFSYWHFLYFEKPIMNLRDKKISSLVITAFMPSKFKKSEVPASRKRKGNGEQKY